MNVYKVTTPVVSADAFEHTSPIGDEPLMKVKVKSE